MGRFTYQLNDGVVFTLPIGSDRVTILIPEDAITVLVYAPDTLPNLLTVYVEPTRTGTTFVPLHVNGANVTIPSDRATVITNYGFRQMQLRAQSAEAIQARLFRVAVQCETASGV